MRRNDPSTRPLASPSDGFAGHVLARLGYELLLSGRGLILLLLITRGFGAAAYGIWSQIGVSIQLFAPFLTLQLGAAVVRYLPRLGFAIDQKKAIYSVLGLTSLASLVVIAAGILARRPLAGLLFGDPTLETYALLCIGMLCVRALLFEVFAYYRAHKRFAFNTITQGTLTVLQLLAILFIVWRFDGQLKIALGAMLGIDGLALAVLSVRIVLRERKPSFSWSIIARFLRYSLPLVPVVLLTWVLRASDRYVIVHYLDLESAGAYSAIYRLAHLIRLFAHSLQYVSFPIIATFWERGDRAAAGERLSLAVRWFGALAIPAVAGLIGLGSPALAHLSGGIFQTSSWLIVCLAIAECLTGFSILLVLVFYLSERTWVQPTLYAALAGLNVGLNLVWVPRWGIIGAAISTCLSSLLLVCGVAWIGRRELRIHIPWDILAKASIASVPVFLLAWLLPLQGLAGVFARFVCCVLVYGVIAWKWGIVRREDLLWLRSGKQA